MDPELTALIRKTEALTAQRREAKDAERTRNRDRMRQHLPEMFGLCEQLKGRGVTFRITQLETPE